MAARNHHFDGNAISDVDPPAFCGTVSDAIDNTEGFVARNCRQLDRQDTHVLLDVAATDAAGLDP
jgi:hypothetical protein